MTLPVFSDQEVRHIRATKKVCSMCKGVRMVVVNVPTKMYACGYYAAAVKCGLCGGTGLTDHITVTDGKSAAAGDPEPEPAGNRDRDEWKHEAAEQQRLK